MYSQNVIARAVAAYEAKAGHKLICISNAKRDDWRAHLEKRLATHAGDVNALAATYTTEEKLFIRNERVMSMLSFSYWSHNATIQREGGGICNFDYPWESTNILLRFIASIEEEMHDYIRRGEMTPYVMPEQTKPAVPGILIVNNKSRQMASTTLGRLITMHRITTQSQRRALAASVDDDKIQEMYDRDKLVYDNLPFYLKPDLLYDEKRAHIHMNQLNSRILYQTASQKSGVGTGRQIDIHHLTELSTWPWPAPDKLEVDFFPAIPRSIHTFGWEESSPYGRGGWWHWWSENVRKGRVDRWRYKFIPWYAELSKYRSLPPEGWRPNQISLLHAQKIHDTSPEYVGKTVMLPRENLYWWEVTRQSYKDGNKLNQFYTSYSVTPEESFQHQGLSAFSADWLEEMRLTTTHGQTYEIARA